MKARIDQAALQHALEGQVLAGVEGDAAAEGRTLVGELVRDWAREADSDQDPPAVLAVLRKDLDGALVNQGPAARVETLRVQVLERKVNRLSARCNALGQAVVDGRLGKEEARAKGQALLAEFDGVWPVLAAVKDGAVAARLRRDLNEARMDALYAVERQAMSRRLADYQQSHGAAGK